MPYIRDTEENKDNKDNDKTFGAWARKEKGPYGKKIDAIQSSEVLH